jgi:hypothetical protein
MNGSSGLTARASAAALLATSALLLACGDDSASGSAGGGGSATTSTGADAGATTGAGGAGGAEELVCTDVLEVDGTPGNAHGELCIACLETECCGALAACGADADCVACLEDISAPGCSANAAVLDLGGCGIDACEGTGCFCLTCACDDDGVCDMPGNELCHCADCVDDPLCTGVCGDDRLCDDLDSCTCAECDDHQCNTQCNGDGFCDEYFEGCACVDCADAESCVRP